MIGLCAQSAACPPKDGKLIDGFLGGAPNETNVVIGWIRSVVFHSCWHQLENAEDVVSDTVVKLLILLRAGKFRHESTLKVYVSRIARYTVVDAIRREKRARDVAPEDLPMPQQAVSPEGEYLELEKRKIFQRILSILDEKCRHLFELIFVERLTYASIAVREKISENAIKTRAFRCREKAVTIKNEIEAKLHSA